MTDAEVRRAGTSYEQFRRSLGSDVARGYLGLAMSGSTARWMLASDEACRALYAHWIAAGGPDSDQGRAQFSAGELGAPGYARQDQPRADPASAVTGVATGRGTARARGGGARLLPTAAAPPRDAPAPRAKSTAHATGSPRTTPAPKTAGTPRRTTAAEPGGLFAGATLGVIGLTSTLALHLAAAQVGVAQNVAGPSTGGLVALIGAWYMYRKCHSWAEWRRKIWVWIAITAVLAFFTAYSFFSPLAAS